MQNRLGQFDDVLVRLDDHDSLPDQMQLMMPQIMEQIDGQDHLAPFICMAQELAPKIDGLIKAAEVPAQQLDQYRQRCLPAGAQRRQSGCRLPGHPGADGLNGPLGAVSGWLFVSGKEWASAGCVL